MLLKLGSAYCTQNIAPIILIKNRIKGEKNTKKYRIINDNAVFYMQYLLESIPTNTALSN